MYPIITLQFPSKKYTIMIDKTTRPYDLDCSYRLSTSRENHDHKMLEKITGV